jgi:hypothetical protein
MAKTPNLIKTVQVTISTTEPVQEYLDQLVATGLYGKNPAEAAERLLTRTIEMLIKEGSLSSNTQRHGKRDQHG